MQINVEKFLAMTALLAVGTAVGCSSDSKNSNGGPSTTTDSGAGGSAGSGTGGKGGSGGKGGATSDAGTGGKGGTAGAGGSGGTDAGKPDSGGGECLGDVAPPTPDAGSEGFFDPCSVLPYYNDSCYPDSGVEGTPLGVSVCSAGQYALRPGVAAALPACLAAITESPCSEEGRSKVIDCVDQVTSKACEKPKMDGGVDPCASIKNCGEVTPATCRSVLQAFTDESVNAIGPCLDAALATDSGAVGCQTAFLGCLQLGLTF